MVQSNVLALSQEGCPPAATPCPSGWGRRALFSATVLLLLLLLLLLLPGPGEAKTIRVDDSGDGDFATIQEAVDAAEEGDTIRVYAGTYVGEVNIWKRLSVMADDPGNTILETPRNYSRAVVISADEVSFQGFRIENGSSIQVRNT